MRFLNARITMARSASPSPWSPVWMPAGAGIAIFPAAGAPGDATRASGTGRLPLARITIAVHPLKRLLTKLSPAKTIAVAANDETNEGRPYVRTGAGQAGGGGG